MQAVSVYFVYVLHKIYLIADVVSMATPYTWATAPSATRSWYAIVHLSGSSRFRGQQPWAVPQQVRCCHPLMSRWLEVMQVCEECALCHFLAFWLVNYWKPHPTDVQTPTPVAITHCLPGHFRLITFSALLPVSILCIETHAQNR